MANTTNGLGNVFLRDLLTGTTTRASLGPGGQQPDRNCQLAALSANGQVLAFTTSATNLTPLSGRFYVNLYVRDLATGTTTLETPSRRGGLANAPTFEASLSGNGRFLAFASYAHNLVRATRLGHHQNVFLRDRRKGRTVLVSATPDGGEGNGISFGPFVTDDGATVAFSSFATDLVPGGTSGQGDVFLRHVRTGATERVRFTTGDVEPDSGVFLADMTPDGRFLLARSSAGNLVPNDTNSDNDFVEFVSLRPGEPEPGQGQRRQRRRPGRLGHRRCQAVGRRRHGRVLVARLQSRAERHQRPPRHLRANAGRQRGEAPLAAYS